MDDTGRAALRRLPAVGALLEAPELSSLIAEHGRPLVTRAIRDAVARARDALRRGGPASVTRVEVEAALLALTTPSLRRVINGTGVVLHTNLGRARLAPEAWAAAQAVAEGYSSLELDLEAGERGDRHAHVAELVAELLGADGGLAFNNCAGATLLMLGALCKGKEVIVSRGQLVEIGGGFRVPDVLRESGADLVEVGTTNKVYARDYEAAITERTGAILVVHRSNFAIVGFTAQPELHELAAVARAAGVLLLVDQGSGLLASTEDLGAAADQMADEPRPADAIAAGADLVAFSGDKLLGGPQAGLLAGTREALAKVKRHPLARALRADKMTLAALEVTLRMYRDGRAREIPAIRDLAASEASLELRARALAHAIRSAADLDVEVTPGESVPGGGSLPLARLPTRLVRIGAPGAPARALAAGLRAGRPPVVARMIDDRVALDVRTIEDDELSEVAEAVRTAALSATSARRREVEE